MNKGVGWVFNPLQDDLVAGRNLWFDLLEMGVVAM
jgi:hypothetical protein